MDFSAVLLLCCGIVLGYNALQTGSVTYSCKEGEAYYTCRSCELTCDSISSGHVSNCSQSCFEGCFCRNGLVRAKDKTCIAPEDCFRPKCQENEEYKECGLACELNCTNINSDLFCTKPCYSGCFCKPDYVRDAGRRCVLPSSCNVEGNQQCGINEHYVNCVSFCNTCWEMNNCRPSFCEPGCDCKPGFYRDYYGQCVTERQCYSSLYGLQTTCGTNEEFKSCVNPCNDCVSKGRCSYQYNCESGCDCKPGFLRSDKGVCVSQQYCYKQQCAENEIYLDCGPSCRTTCLNFRQIIHDRCKRDCVPGCHCQANFVLGPNGKCIKPEFCPRESLTQCPPNEKYYLCVPTCRNTCANWNDTNPKCDTNCVKGCFCRDDLVRRQDGVCVPPSQCPSVRTDPVCPPSEVFYQCLPTCRTTCQSLNSTTGLCSTLCRSGCFCQPSLVKNDNGTCVRPDDCFPPPKPTCPAGEVFYDCLPCPTTCNAINSTIRDTRICLPGCACAKGLVKRQDGSCVKPQNCELVCGENEEYRICGPACPPTCSNLNSNLPCIEKCVRGCFCTKGFVLGPDGLCIAPSSCPTRSKPCPLEPFGIQGRRSGSDDDDESPSSTESTNKTTSATTNPDTAAAPPATLTTFSFSDTTSPETQMPTTKQDVTTVMADAPTTIPSRTTSVDISTTALQTQAAEVTNPTRRQPSTKKEEITTLITTIIDAGNGTTSKSPES